MDSLYNRQRQKCIIGTLDKSVIFLALREYFGNFKIRPPAWVLYEGFDM